MQFPSFLVLRPPALYVLLCPLLNGPPSFPTKPGLPTAACCFLLQGKEGASQGQVFPSGVLALLPPCPPGTPATGLPPPLGLSLGKSRTTFEKIPRFLPTPVGLGLTDPRGQRHHQRWLLLRKAILLRNGKGGHITRSVHDDLSNAEELV